MKFHLSFRFRSLCIPFSFCLHSFFILIAFCLNTKYVETECKNNVNPMLTKRKRNYLLNQQKTASITTPRHATQQLHRIFSATVCKYIPSRYARINGAFEAIIINKKKRNETYQSRCNYVSLICLKMCVRSMTKNNLIKNKNRSRMIPALHCRRYYSLNHWLEQGWR